jgi:two-component system phosphate regulon sensor histidine kinase PhoR
MGFLIEDLIALSRLESVPESQEQTVIQIRPILDMIRNDALAAVIGERSILIECDDTVSLMGNQSEIQSAFSNLVMNATQYTQDGGEIIVRWLTDSQHEYLVVEDNGDGIDDVHLPRITERFYRVDKSRTTETGGTGLGLAIVKHILLRHQGELRISSQIGQGSIFTCVFPRNRGVIQPCAAS